MTAERRVLQAAMEAGDASLDDEATIAIDRVSASGDGQDFRLLVELLAFAIGATHRACTPNALDRAKRLRDYVAARLATHPRAEIDGEYQVQRLHYQKQLRQGVPLEEFIAVSDGVIAEVSDAIAREGARPREYPNAALVLTHVSNWNRLAKTGRLPGAYSSSFGLRQAGLPFGKVEDRLAVLERLYLRFFRQGTPEQD
jgi:hypothetical protein